jgi:hypothetical protein
VVLKLMCEGYSTKEVAARLNISPTTVLTHRVRMFDKVGVHNAVRLLRWALTEGLVDFEIPPAQEHGDQIAARQEGPDGVSHPAVESHSRLGVAVGVTLGTAFPGVQPDDAACK